MTPRLALLLALGAAAVTHSSAARAGIGIVGNPESLRPKLVQNLVVKGWVSGVKLTGRHGRSVEVRLPRPVALDDTLSLPAGDWTDLTLSLTGPITVSVDGAAPILLELDALPVVMDDPGASVVQLQWSLPDGAALRSETELLRALEDGAIAVPCR